MTRDRADVLGENFRLSRAEAPIYDMNHFEIFHPWEQQRLRRHLERYRNSDRVLDVCAGTGNALTKVHASVRVGLDLSPEMLGQLRDKDADAIAVIGEAEALPFGAGSFDLVVIYSALHHLADWTALAEMRRVVRVGGTVLLEHEEAFRSRGWRGIPYWLIRSLLRMVAAAWYWHRPSARVHVPYRRVCWPYSDSMLGTIDFSLTDGGHPDPTEIEAELARLGMRTRRWHYLLAPLPMSSRWQQIADRICVRCRFGHFAIEATR